MLPTLQSVAEFAPRGYVKVTNREDLRISVLEKIRKSLSFVIVILKLYRANIVQKKNIFF